MEVDQDDHNSVRSMRRACSNPVLLQKDSYVPSIFLFHTGTIITLYPLYYESS